MLPIENTAAGLHTLRVQLRVPGYSWLHHRQQVGSGQPFPFPVGVVFLRAFLIDSSPSSRQRYDFEDDSCDCSSGDHACPPCHRAV